jgi:hypothetical protein
MSLADARAKLTRLPLFPALEELKSRHQWVAWRYETRGENITKPPINPHTGNCASVSNQNDWGTYEQAYQYALAHQLPGVGYVITDDDDLTGGDLDHCLDEHGVLEQWAEDIVGLAETYTEISPSGKGLWLIWRGKISASVKYDPAHVEIYRGGRYLTITGNHIPSTPDNILPAPQTEARLMRRVIETRDIIRRAAELRDEAECKKNNYAQTYPKGLSIASPVPSGSGNDYFRNVNSAALRNLAAWVPNLFGRDAIFQPGTGAWRISSKALGRNLQEDLSISPLGIKDWGVHDIGDPRSGNRTPIDLVLDYGGACDAVEASEWLCKCLGAAPESLGWNSQAENAEPVSDDVSNQKEQSSNNESEDDDLGKRDASELPSIIPPRAWLLGNLFCRRYASSIIADGAVGKTSLRYAQLMSLAIGRSLTGDHVFQRCRVLIVSLEDDENEVNRRIEALCQHYGIKRSELAGYLFVATPGHRGGKLLTLDKHGHSVVGGLARKLRRTVEKHKIDLACLDPFVKTHSVEENNNSMIDEVVQILTDLSIEYDIAIDIPHHTSKGTSDPGNANRARGASSMKDAARLVYSLSPMTAEEAQTFNLSEAERRFLVRMDSAKVNIAPPMTEARWFKLVGVDIGNGTKMYPAGDKVQAIEPWEPPNMWDSLSHDQIRAILADIDRGLPDGNFYTDAKSATHRAAWKVVERHCPALGEAQCRKVIASWVSSKPPQLIRTTYRNPVDRKKAQCVRTEELT